MPDIKLNVLGYQAQKPLCSSDCWHYDVFGGKEGCGQWHGGWGGWPESVRPGEPCLHPEQRKICEPLYVGDLLGLCNALEGTIIEGGPHDNTSLVTLLTS